MLRSPKSKRSSVAAQSILRRVESERDEASADLRRMTTERDSLRERLKVSATASDANATLTRPFWCFGVPLKHMLTGLVVMDWRIFWAGWCDIFWQDWLQCEVLR